MNALLPINKITLASFAFLFTHWKKVLEISILPMLLSVPFFFVLPKIIITAEQMFNAGVKGPITIDLPEYTIVYFILFFYAYITLSINMYRLVILGDNNVSGIALVFKFGQMMRFIGLTLFISVVTMVPVLITGITLLQLVAAFLVVPITLNFINISLNERFQYRWNLGFLQQVNLFALQAALPTLFMFVFVYIGSALGIAWIVWIVKLIVFYWTLVSLALCYQIIIQAKKPLL